jgi:hypothetical protein
MQEINERVSSDIDFNIKKTMQREELERDFNAKQLTKKFGLA